MNRRVADVVFVVILALATLLLYRKVGDAPRKPSVPPAAMSEFQWVKETFKRRPAGTQWFYDDIFLCAGARPRRIFSYDRATKMAVERNDVTTIADLYCRSIRETAPLSVAFHYEDESLFWNLGPYDRGSYAFVWGNGVRVFDVPRSDGFRLPRVTALRIRARYTAPEGWVTYSRELSLDFTKQRDFEWHRSN